MNTPTPRERFRKTLDISTGVSELLADSNASYIHWLEKELITVTKERDRLAEAFQDMLNDTLTPTNDEWIVTDNENYIEIASIKTCDSIASVHGGKTIGDQYDLAGRIARVPQLERELTAVTEQRDRLTEALMEVATYDPSDGQCNSGYSCKYIAEQALRSLNPDHTVAANDMIADVKGGADES